MEENWNWIKDLPHGNDIEAVSGFIYIGDADHILSFWDELVQNNTIHTGTNFDLSNDIESIDRSKKLYIHYDFLHRVMLSYYDLEKKMCAKAMELDEFKKYIGIS